uniref:Uncharacterized protein n=1 Tax=Chlorobium chlorochromatii (strain CaD3) TaxID=340177 RepID=Q3ARH9_CHLCH
MPQKASSNPAWIGYAGLALGLLLIGLLFSQLDLQRSFALIADTGWYALLILLPFGALHLLETFAWQHLFPQTSGRVPFVRLLKIQIIAETVSMTFPAGVAVGEPLRPFLCHRLLGIPVPLGVASIAVRKLLLSVAQGVYTLVGSLFGFALLQQLSPTILRFNGLGYIMVTMGLSVLLLFLFVLILLLNGNVAEKVHSLLMRIPFEKVRQKLLAHEAGFLATDKALQAFRGNHHPRLWLVLLLYVTAWCMLALESYLILQALGIQIPFMQVLTIDVALTMLRTIFFFIPSGLGVQDVGYLLFFQALGIPEAVVVGGAFVLFRRLKELLWYALGYVLMFFSGIHLGDAASLQGEAE